MLPELSATTNFTFLAGASHSEEMARRAGELGLTHIAVADRNSVAGVVRAHVALREMAREGAAAVREKTNVDYHDVRSRAAKAGEMLDWEAPTGGYLLTACLATGLRAGRAAARFAARGA